ncbi:uncharacterized protein LOC143029922 [Oratosquilla oratoria]|uniref:uncharacterized protein LOC143029922 n=1 Tax=Oratosquilla oratoria TaxID=337810 RepID=UPI003F76F897
MAGLLGIRGQNLYDFFSSQSNGLGTSHCDWLKRLAEQQKESEKYLDILQHREDFFTQDETKVGIFNKNVIQHSRKESIAVHCEEHKDLEPVTTKVKKDEDGRNLGNKNKNSTTKNDLEKNKEEVLPGSDSRLYTQFLTPGNLSPLNMLSCNDMGASNFEVNSSLLRGLLSPRMGTIRVGDTTSDIALSLGAQLDDSSTVWTSALATPAASKESEEHSPGSEGQPSFVGEKLRQKVLVRSLFSPRTPGRRKSNSSEEVGSPGLGIINCHSPVQPFLKMKRKRSHSSSCSSNSSSQKDHSHQSELRNNFDGDVYDGHESSISSKVKCKKRQVFANVQEKRIRTSTPVRKLECDENSVVKHQKTEHSFSTTQAFVPSIVSDIKSQPKVKEPVDCTEVPFQAVVQKEEQLEVPGRSSESQEDFFQFVCSPVKKCRKNSHEEPLEVEDRTFSKVNSPERGELPDKIAEAIIEKSQERKPEAIVQDLISWKPLVESKPNCQPQIENREGAAKDNSLSEDYLFSITGTTGNEMHGQLTDDWDDEGDIEKIFGKELVKVEIIDTGKGQYSEHRTKDSDYVKNCAEDKVAEEPQNKKSNMKDVNTVSDGYRDGEMLHTSETRESGSKSCIGSSENEQELISHDKNTEKQGICNQFTKEEKYERDDIASKKKVPEKEITTPKLSKSITKFSLKKKRVSGTFFYPTKNEDYEHSHMTYKDNIVNSSKVQTPRSTEEQVIENIEKRICINLPKVDTKEESPQTTNNIHRMANMQQNFISLSVLEKQKRFIQNHKDIDMEITRSEKFQDKNGGIKDGLRGSESHKDVSKSSKGGAERPQEAPQLFQTAAGEKVTISSTAIKYVRSQRSITGPFPRDVQEPYVVPWVEGGHEGSLHHKDDIRKRMKDARAVPDRNEGIKSSTQEDMDNTCLENLFIVPYEHLDEPENVTSPVDGEKEIEQNYGCDVEANSDSEIKKGGSVGFEGLSKPCTGFRTARGSNVAINDVALRHAKQMWEEEMNKVKCTEGEMDGQISNHVPLQSIKDSSFPGKNNCAPGIINTGRERGGVKVEDSSSSSHEDSNFMPVFNEEISSKTSIQENVAKGSYSTNVAQDSEKCKQDEITASTKCHLTALSRFKEQLNVKTESNGKEVENFICKDVIAKGNSKASNQVKTSIAKQMNAHIEPNTLSWESRKPQLPILPTYDVEMNNLDAAETFNPENSGEKVKGVYTHEEANRKNIKSLNSLNKCSFTLPDVTKDFSIGFSTGLGKSIQVSNKSLECARNLWKDIEMDGDEVLDTEFEKTNTTKKINEVIRNDFGENTLHVIQNFRDNTEPEEEKDKNVPNCVGLGKIPLIGFQTAQGSQVHTNREGLNRVKSVFMEDQDTEEICINLPNISLHRENDRDFKTVRGISHNENNEALDHMKVTNTGRNSFSEKITSMGFQTAQGSHVDVNKNDLNRARLLFKEDEDMEEENKVIAHQYDKAHCRNFEVSSAGKNKFSEKIASTGFQTAQGSRVIISKKALNRARLLFEEDQDMEENNRVIANLSDKAHSSNFDNLRKLGEVGKGSNSEVPEHVETLNSVADKDSLGEEIRLNRILDNFVNQRSTTENETKLKSFHKESLSSSSSLTKNIQGQGSEFTSGLVLKESSNFGFQTAAGSQVMVSEKALLKAKTLMELELGDVYQKPLEKALPGAGLEQELLVQNFLTSSPDLKLNQYQKKDVACFGFRTGKGENLVIDNAALERAKNLFTDVDFLKEDLKLESPQEELSYDLTGIENGAPEKQKLKSDTEDEEKELCDLSKIEDKGECEVEEAAWDDHCASPVLGCASPILGSQRSQAISRNFIVKRLEKNMHFNVIDKMHGEKGSPIQSDAEQSNKKPTSEQDYKQSDIETLQKSIHEERNRNISFEDCSNMCSPPNYSNEHSKIETQEISDITEIFMLDNSWDQENVMSEVKPKITRRSSHSPVTSELLDDAETMEEIDSITLEQSFIDQDISEKRQLARLKQDKAIAFKKDRSVPQIQGWMHKLKMEVKEEEDLQNGQRKHDRATEDEKDITDEFSDIEDQMDGKERKKIRNNNKRKDEISQKDTDNANKDNLQPSRKKVKLKSFWPLQNLYCGKRSAAHCVTAENAATFRFNFSEAKYNEDVAVQCRDNMNVVLAKDNSLGAEEVERGFLAAPGVHPKLVPPKWVANHYRWIIWKLAATERRLGYYMNSKVLTLENVMSNLKYRYDREIDRAQRPVLRKITEQDDIPQKTMVLCVVAIKCSAMDTKDIRETSSSPQNVTLELTDGWYSIECVVDAGMVHQIEEGRVRIGSKLVVHGAELVGSLAACHPLEAHSMKLRLHTNMVRVARWWARLGGGYGNKPILSRISSVVDKGGLIGKITVALVRVYPTVYLQRIKGSMRAVGERAHQVLQREALAFRDQKTHKVMMEVEREYEKKQEAKKKVHCTEEEIRQMTSGKDIALFLESANDPSSFEGILVPWQYEAASNWRQHHADEKRREIWHEVQQRLSKIPQQNYEAVPVLKIRAMDSSCKVAMLTVWRPTEDLLQTVTEGKCFSIYYLMAAGHRHGLLQLNTTRQTRWEVCSLALSKILLEDINYDSGLPRSTTPLCRTITAELQPPHGEIDVVGVVLQFGKEDLSGQLVYLVDHQFNIFGVKFWGGLKGCGVMDTVQIGALVCLSNVSWRGHVRGWIGCGHITEYTIVTTTPRGLHLQESLQHLKNSIKDMKEHLQQANLKLDGYFNGLTSPYKNTMAQNGIDAIVERKSTMSLYSKPRGQLQTGTPTTEASKTATTRAEERSKDIQRKLQYLEQFSNPAALPLINGLNTPKVKQAFKVPFKNKVALED